MPDPDFRPPVFKRCWWMGVAIVSVGSLIGLVLGAGITYVMPKWYESTCVVEIMPAVGGQTIPREVKTELELIKSKGFLSKLVLHLGLVDRWGIDTDSCVRKLDQTVLAESIRETDTVRIRVRQRSPEVASDIAGGVVVVYNRIANERHKADLELPIRELRNFVRELEERADIRRKALAEMLKWHGPDQRATMPFKEFEDLMSELGAAKLKLIELGIIAKTDINAMVIRDSPAVSKNPISPDLPRNLILGASAGFVLFSLLLLPLVWLLNRRRIAFSPSQSGEDFPA
jgi:hypothetical protein